MLRNANFIWKNNKRESKKYGNIMYYSYHGGFSDEGRQIEFEQICKTRDF
jgi:hypothetical protein